MVALRRERVDLPLGFASSVAIDRPLVAFAGEVRKLAVDAVELVGGLTEVYCVPLLGFDASTDGDGVEVDDHAVELMAARMLARCWSSDRRARR